MLATLHATMSRDADGNGVEGTEPSHNIMAMEPFALDGVFEMRAMLERKGGVNFPLVSLGSSDWINFNVIN